MTTTERSMIDDLVKRGGLRKPVLIWLLSLNGRRDVALPTRDKLRLSRLWKKRILQNS